jgi:hypothetical protein
MSLFDTKELAVLDSLFGSGSPATYSLGVSSTVPFDNGTNITEPSGGSYARVTVNNNSTVFSPASGGSKTNGGASGTLSFSQASATWGAALGWWVLYDGATPVIWGTLTPAKTIDTGDVLRILQNQMTITCD